MRSPTWYKIPIGKFKITYPSKISKYSYGMYYAKNGNIEIKRNLSHNIKAQTIVHEIVHALCTSKGFFKQKERDVEMITESVVHFIKENPYIIKYIQSNDNSIIESIK